MRTHSSDRFDLLMLVCAIAIPCGCNRATPNSAPPAADVTGTAAIVKAGRIEPHPAVPVLLTPERQKAFEELQSWWKTHQPEADVSFDDPVGRVDRYLQAGGEPITVVFTGEPEKQNGEFCLINADGRQTRIFQRTNYLDEDDQFVDVNGDQLPEIVACHAMGGHADENRNRVVTDAAGLNILPITSEQVPLLRVIFDVRPFNAPATWRWRLVEKTAGVRDVVVERQAAGEWHEQARFVWSAEKSKYEGPSGSKQAGFLAAAGNIETAQIEEFLKRTRTE
jgi:hypothetical protein